MGSNEDKGTPCPSRGNTGDEEFDANRAKLRAAWEASYARDRGMAEELGRRIVARVDARMTATEAAFNAPLEDHHRGRWSTAEVIAARRAALVSTAETARKRYRGVRYRSAEKLKDAVRAHCIAEYGAIVGFEYREHDQLGGDSVVGLVVDNLRSTASIHREAQGIYTRLRRAIVEAHAFAFERPNGIGGAAGEALRVARCILPILPDLTELPHAARTSVGRGPQIRQLEELVFRALGHKLSSRDLAVLSLLAGNVPGSYARLLKARREGMTTFDVIDLESRYVDRVRKGASNVPTGART